ncbi:MAG TPA: FAD-dependent oxidoreductase [Planctomycetes bacterium]|nr:FAD-dependent oxidoreductase [Planctomycetota bacterium]
MKGNGFAGLLSGWVLVWLASVAAGATVLVEAESFRDHGGWKLDTQSVDIMGSPYLLAHGLGRPVTDAATEIPLPEPGTYRVFVRTKDWVAPWNAPGQPGRFQLWIDGKPLEETFGTKGAEWFWHDGGTVELRRTRVRLRLHDLTGFDGRCDAILLTTDLGFTPPNDSEVLPRWRRELLGLPERPVEKAGYDLVVIGGGYSGTAAAVSAARMGCKVALIQDRPVLGGNGSSEVRVWAQGLTRRGRFPRIGEIVEELADSATKSPGRAEEFEDDKKLRVVRGEENIDLFLNHRAYNVEKEDDRIAAVLAFDTRTNEYKRFVGRLYADCTGHGTIGYLAGADWDMTRTGHMGMSNMWRWEVADKPVPFPETPWALDLTMKDFPYPHDGRGEWFWESGFDKDPIQDVEAIRDWNLRAVYGAFNAMKNRDGAEKHRKAVLTWVAFIAGPRESRRLLGDVVLTKEDIVTKRMFPDGCVPSTWSIDLHYPKEPYAQKYPDNPFIAMAVFDRRVDRRFGYPIPYRCFYSRNISNLFMAGRCISVTHEALGSVRVMKTCGMMGEVVGKAASLCVHFNCTPRDIYRRYLDELFKLLQLPGKARRQSVSGPIVIPSDVPPEAPPYGPPTGIDPRSLSGIVVDDVDASASGPWTEGAGVKGYIGYGYRYAQPDSGAKLRFQLKLPRAGRYELRLAYRPHPNRGTHVPVTVLAGDREKKSLRINMRQEPPLAEGFLSLGVFSFEAGQEGTVLVGTEEAGGIVCADAVQAVPVP